MVRLSRFFPAGLFGAVLALPIIVAFGLTSGVVGTKSAVAEGSVAQEFQAAFSPDGTKLASVGADGALAVLDLESGHELGSFEDASGGVGAFAFDPDSRTLASASGGRVALWDLASVSELRVLQADSGSATTRLVYSPRGDAVAAVVDGRTIAFWDLSQNALATLRSRGNAAVTEIAFSADGVLLASVGAGPQVTLWDPAARQERPSVTSPTGAAMTGVAFAPMGRTLAGADQDGSITLWNLDTGARTVLSGHADVVKRFAFSPDGSRLASEGADGQLLVWNVASRQLEAALPARDDARVAGLAFGPDGATLASVGDDDAILLWDLESGTLADSLAGHRGPVQDLAFGASGRILTGVGTDGQVVVWDLDTGEVRFAANLSGAPTAAVEESSGAPAIAGRQSDPLPTLESIGTASDGEAVALESGNRVEGPSGQSAPPGKGSRHGRRDWKGVTALALSPNGQRVGSAHSGGEVRLWNDTLGELSADAGPDDAPATGAAFTADGKRLVSVGRESEVRWWDAATGQLSHRSFGHEHPARTIAASPAGDLVASAGDETRIMIWAAATGKLARICNRHRDFVNGLAFGSDGKLASAGADASILVWDPRTCELLAALNGHTGEVNAVAFSRDNLTLASAGADSSVRLWDLASGQQIASLAGHDAPVRTVAFSPNGKLLASAGEDARIRIWDVAAPRLIDTLPAANGPINALLFLPNGHLLGADDSGQIGEWDLGSVRKLRSAKPTKQPRRHAKALSAVPGDASSLGGFAALDERPAATADVGQHLGGLAAGLVGQLLEWLIPAAQADVPPPPGGPILVVTSSASTYGSYYPEILRNEGLNAFAVMDIGAVTATVLNGYDVAILAPAALSGTQVTMLTNWVTAGGNLIAMRPDQQLAGLLGLTATGATLSEGYLLVDTSTSPGNGIVGQTMQFHGTADRYTANGASSLATLYTNATTATANPANPALTLRSVGSSGGQAAAFAYDLATSIVYTRQGNPLWSGQERDGASPIRSDDLYYGNAAGDPRADWVDLNKAAMPQADEQQRLLANLILHMTLDRKPLPRLWYFPGGHKAVVVMTGDDHGNNGTEGRWNSFLAASPSGCSVTDWQCVRGTSYMYPSTPLDPAKAISFEAQGFEAGLHINTGCADFTQSQLETLYVQQLADFAAAWPGVPAPTTQRHHCIAWSDWVTAAKVQLNHGIRLDTSYYFWPPNWVQNRPGFFNGSGMPMRFADLPTATPTLNGRLIDVYQDATEMTDESGQTYPFTIDTLLDRALGAEGYYGAYTVNAHTDQANPDPNVAAYVVSSAQPRGVPIVTSRQMLEWLDFRNSSSFKSLAWNGNALSFTVAPAPPRTPPASATWNVPTNALQVLLPARSPAGVIAGISKGGTAVNFTRQTIKGVNYAVFLASTGTEESYIATYAADTTAPGVTGTTPAAGATGVGLGTAVSATFSEAMDPTTITSSTFELRAGTTPVASTVTYSGTTATLTPTASLAPSTTYTATVRGGTTDPRVKDLSGNALGASVSWSFTTGSAPCVGTPCSAWLGTAVPANPSVSDTSAVELGVKFRSEVAGYITGVRFYKWTGNTGTHVGNLWSVGGTSLATATFTNETATGWQQVNFDPPVAIVANTVYVASYYAPNGRYAGDNGYFANSGVDNPPIHLLQDGVSGGNGVYAYGATSSFPDRTWNSSNYWVDVVFTTSTGPDTTAPTVIATSPASGATGVNAATPVTATFSEAMAPGTITASTFELRAGTNPPLNNPTVTYSGTTATLTPTSALAASTTYTAKLVSGANGVKDVAGNALAQDYSWAFTTAAGTGGCTSPPNDIVRENCLAGNLPSEWDLTSTDLSDTTSIQGFATDISVNKGGTVNFKINTNAEAYRLDIYRMGYYGGRGARKMTTVNGTGPRNQPPCLTDSATGLIDCGNWTTDPAAWTVPANAISGIYFAKAVRTDTGRASHIFFIVRDDSGASDILFQTSDTTWQAYNTWGGNSLYMGGGPGTGGGAGGRAYKVSYNRPFNTRSVDNGQDWVFNAEYPMVRWLEANGYSVGYSTGVDSDRRGDLIRNHRVFLSVGHDEYWSGQQRANVEAARDAGVHLVFLSGNEVFWKTRWENAIDGSETAYRTLVCYKETHTLPINPNPTTVWTGTWRDPRGTTLTPPVTDGGRPENALMGPIFTVNDGATTSIVVPAADGKMRFWRNTSVANLAAGASVTLPNGTLGYEWDEDLDNGFRPAGLVRLSTTIVNNAPVLTDYGSTFGSGTANHALTLYRAASGALVFGAGTVQWSWGLDATHDRAGTPADARMQQATVNLLADMGVQPGSLQAPLTAATASTDAVAPTSAITLPANGANVAQGTPLSITGTATDTGGGVVGGVEVSVDGGTSWHPASGGATWSYNWTPTTSGSVTIRSRAVDDSGNIQTPGAGVTVTVGGGGAGCTSNCTIWPGTAVPVTTDGGADSPVELGVKFRSDVAGTIAGVRFYKASANTGTHVGNLWSSTGALLATASFSNETTSGWQQVNFATPVAITANTTYVASYHANAGHYSADINAFASVGVDNPPLHALASPVSSGNGVYAYGANSAFPSQTWNAANYWVDVVFTPMGSDTQAPTVAISAPAAEATVTGAVSVSATASDNVGVTSVQFLLDDAALGAPDTTAPYGVTWDTTTATNGAHILKARASDAAGNTGTATAVNVTVSNGGGTDTQVPTATMTAPAAGATVTGAVSVSANASDNVGVTSVQFLLDGAALGAPDTTTPYGVTWDTTTAPNGAHTVSARASDAAGNTGTATAVNVTVSNAIATGFRSPTADAAVTSSAGDNNGFQTTPRDAYADGGAVGGVGGVAVDPNSGTGTGTSCTGGGKDKHVYRDFGFNVPSGSTIRGIEVRLDALVDDSANSPKMCVQLSWNGGTSWTAAKSTANLTKTETTYLLGGPGDNWSRSWSSGNFSNANFRVRISNVASSTSRDFSLDYVAVQVTY